MLPTDQIIFESKFPEATKFLEAAELRREAYALSLLVKRMPREAALFAKLLKCTACKEPWFLELLRHDAWHQKELEALIESTTPD